MFHCQYRKRKGVCHVISKYDEHAYALDHSFRAYDLLVYISISLQDLLLRTLVLSGCNAVSSGRAC